MAAFPCQFQPQVSVDHVMWGDASTKSVNRDMIKCDAQIGGSDGSEFWSISSQRIGKLQQRGFKARLIFSPCGLTGQMEANRIRHVLERRNIAPT